VTIDTHPTQFGVAQSVNCPVISASSQSRPRTTASPLRAVVRGLSLYGGPNA